MPKGRQVKTRDPAKALEEIAAEYGMEAKDLSFDVVSMDVYHVPTTQGYVAEYTLDVYPATYTYVEVFDTILDEEEYPVPLANLRVLPTTRVFFQEGNEGPALGELLRKTRAKMALEGVIYGLVSDDEIKNEWLKILEKWSKGKREMSTFVVAKGRPVVHPSREEIYHVPLITYAGRVIDKRSGRMDFKDRGYTERKVEPGNVVVTVEYFPGEMGVKVNGAVIPFKPISPLPFVVDEETLEVKEESKDKKRIYQLIAKVDGFVVIEKGKISLSPVLKLKGVDYSTGSVDLADRPQGVDILISGTDMETTDAVRDGFKVVSPGKAIEIKGSVGRNAVVDGRAVIVKGTVASGAVIRAEEECVLNIVTGASVECDGKVSIARANNATVKSRTVEVNMLSGGRVEGEIVFGVKNLNHTTIAATKLILIVDTMGINNFVIDPMEVEKKREEIRKLKEQKESAEDQIAKTLAQLKEQENKKEGKVTALTRMLKGSVFKNTNVPNLKIKSLILRLAEGDPKVEAQLMPKLPLFAKKMVEEIVDYNDTIAGIEAKIERLRHDVELLTKIIKDESTPKGVVFVVNEIGRDNYVKIGKGKEVFREESRGLFMLVGFPLGEPTAVVKVSEPEEMKSHLVRVLDREDRIYLNEVLSKKGLKSVAELFEVEEVGEMEEDD